MRNLPATFILPGFLLLLLCGAAAWAQDPLSDGFAIEGAYLHAGIDPGPGAALRRFVIPATGGNLAGAEGLLREGFGIGSYYVPNRRLNLRIEPLQGPGGAPMVRQTYDGDGPNIRGLKVTRDLVFPRNEASLRVTWRVTNGGDERQWIAPWVRADGAPGGRIDANDLVVLPATSGITRVQGSEYLPMARNWAAITDPEKGESVVAVFNADTLHSALGEFDPANGVCAFQAHFAPFLLAPGETWETVYRLNAIRGLKRIDFATDEMAAQIDYEDGKLVVLLSAVKPMNGVNINAVVVAPNGRRWPLSTKRFDIDPNRLARCTYDWEAPAPGFFDFLAQLEQGGKAVMLGSDTRSPHGGIDTRFAVGTPAAVPYEAWTDGPYLLERKGQPVDAALVADGPVRAWATHALEKVFPGDLPRAQGRLDPNVRLTLAGNEVESFQLLLRPSSDAPMEDLGIRPGALTHDGGGAVLPASAIRVYRVGTVPVHVPSFYEGATGNFPDVLMPVEGAITLPAGETTALWFTLRTQPGQQPGRYRGLIELQAPGMDPVEVWLEVEVFGFSLPKTPALKTDFGFSLAHALEGARTQGGSPNEAQLHRAYLENALEHRVTLRSLAALPREQARYEEALKKFAGEARELLDAGVTTLNVPYTLFDVPEHLALADAFIDSRGLHDPAFAQLANEPMPAAWPRLLERMHAWKTAAPHIPVMVTTQGLDPFLPDGLDIWAVHTRVMDTPNGANVLARIAGGDEVWCYVNHAPSRPYANLFLDFTALEHRILFWQAWVMGFKGFHYWSVNGLGEGVNPYESQLDITPVNGDGQLVYPGASGPVNSIRWEVVRDGIEDYDYLALFKIAYNALAKRGGNDALLKRAMEARDLQQLVPNLTGFSHDPQVLLQRRQAIAHAIAEMEAALKR